VFVGLAFVRLHRKLSGFTRAARKLKSLETLCFDNWVVGIEVRFSGFEECLECLFTSDATLFSLKQVNPHLVICDMVCSETINIVKILKAFQIVFPSVYAGSARLVVASV
jgi:hypothetical protein